MIIWHLSLSFDSSPLLQSHSQEMTSPCNSKSKWNPSDGYTQTYKCFRIHPLMSRCLTSHLAAMLLLVLWILSSLSFTWTLLYQSFSFSPGYIQLLSLLAPSHQLKYTLNLKKNKTPLYGIHEKPRAQVIVLWNSSSHLSEGYGFPQAAPSLCQRVYFWELWDSSDGWL